MPTGHHLIDHNATGVQVSEGMRRRQIPALHGGMVRVLIGLGWRRGPLRGGLHHSILLVEMSFRGDLHLVHRVLHVHQLQLGHLTPWGDLFRVGGDHIVVVVVIIRGDVVEQGRAEHFD